MTAIINDEASRVRTQVQSQPGRALTFDGVNDYVNMGDILDIGTGTVSASAWIKTTRSAANSILSKNNGLGGTDGVWGFYQLSGKAYAFVVYFDGVSDTVIDATSVISINDDKWHHIAMTFDRDDLKLYVDGNLADTTSAAAIPSAHDLTNTIPLHIGDANGTSHFFGGKIHDVRVYNRALTATEICNLYNATKQSGGDVAGTLYAANLIGWWPLEDMTFNGTMLASLAFDASGNSRHGKIIGPTYHSDAVVPCSIQNELGYSRTATTIRDLPQTYPGIAAFTATGAGTTALTGQSWDGRSGLFAVKFASGATGGYANNRVDTQASSNFSRPTGKSFAISTDVALSRRLVGSEIVVVYFTGAWGNPALVIDTTNQDALMPSGVMKWSSVVGGTVVPQASGSTWLVVYPSTNITGGDLTIYLDNVGHYELTSSESIGGITDDIYLSQSSPALASDLTKDIFGNALHYPGPLAKRALPKASPCATFDGLNDHAVKYGLVLPVDATSLSVCGWIRRSSGGSFQGIIGEWGADPLKRWVVYLNNTNTLALYVSDNGINWRKVSTTSTVAVDTWTHFCATWTGDTIKVYLDGVEGATTTDVVRAVSELNNSSTTNLYMGSSEGTTERFTGRMADLRVFDRVLTPSEVASVYAGNNITSGLAAHWPFAEKSLKLLTDISGNGHNALATGMTSGELWANTQDVYHAGLTAGVRTTNGRRGYRFSNGSNQYFGEPSVNLRNDPEDTGLFWVCWYGRITVATTGFQSLVARWEGAGASSWILYRVNTTTMAMEVSFDLTNSVNATTTLVDDGLNHFVIGYLDMDNRLIGISIDGAAFTTSAFSSPKLPSNANCRLKVGAYHSTPAAFVTGDVFGAALGQSAATAATAIRNAIYNSGSPLSYEDLTPTQIADWGVTAWYDFDEWGPQLRDKHSDNHLTGVNYSADYPVPAVPALLTAPTHEYGTFSKELAGAFNGGHDAKYACTTGQKLWVAAMVRINHYSTAGDGIVSKYNGGTEWDLYAFNAAGDYRFYWIVFDSANVGQSVLLNGMAVGEWIFLFAYIDATSGLSIGLSSDGGAFVISSTASGPRVGTDNFQIGTFFSAAYLHGDIEYVAIGKAPLVSFSDVRDMLYSGGVPLRFGDLTAAQKTTIGLQDWFDVGEYDGSLTLTGKHAASALTGFCIPSAITHGGPKKLPAIDTSIDFTGGVAAPWTDKQYLGYLTCSGSANGRIVTAATAGKFASGNVSVYVRLRNLGTSADRNFLEFDNSGANRGLFGFKTTGALFHIYDGSYRDLGASTASLLSDGEWHDVLFVWNGTLATLYIDNVLWGTSAIGNSATVSALWTRGTVLSDYGNVGKVVGDIARLIVADGVRVPGNITTAPNLLDLRFDSPNCEDEQCRIPSSAWLSGHTPAKITVPTAYKHGVILPEGMVKTADELSERQFKLYKQDQ